ncbi:MAG: cellulase family glycosylhydrolase [Acetatifactor sp.]|nr:cellulase family glycosylhydrolase [Acetatifactor sp.]
MRKKLLCVLMSLALISSCVGCGATSSDSSETKDTAEVTVNEGETEDMASSFENFITCDGTKLMDGDKELQFISLNYPQATSDTAWEQENAVKTIKTMGGNVTRTYVIPAYNGSNKDRAYVAGVDKDGKLIFNEDALNELDQLLALCNEHGVRVIIPLVDHWHWVGGMESYVWLAGESEGETPQPGTFYDWAWRFFTSEKAIDYFKQMIAHLMERENSVTGVKYKDDKAILCWETGNELGGNPSNQEAHDDDLSAWTIDIINYIKSLDSNHLVLDGRMSTTAQSRKSDNPADILGAHYYEGNFAVRCAEETEVVHSEAGKPYILGEFGTYVTAEPCIEVFEQAVQHHANGVMMWSLRAHKDGYGFYFHDEDGYWASYHWPGFEAGSYYGEKEILRSIYAYAQIVNGNASDYESAKNLPIPAPETDEAPLLYENSFTNGSVADIKWRGVVGGAWYEIQRAEGAVDESADESVWTTIAGEEENVYDSGRNWEDKSKDCIAGYHDETAVDGKTYSYRLRACNESGEGLWSNIVTVENVSHNLFDPLDLIAVAADDPNPTEVRNTYSYDHSMNIKCNDGKISNVSATDAGFIEYSATIPLKSIEVESSGNGADITYFASADGISYVPISDTAEISADQKYYFIRVVLAAGSSETIDSIRMIYANDGESYMDNAIFDKISANVLIRDKDLTQGIRSTDGSICYKTKDDINAFRVTVAKEDAAKVKALYSKDGIDFEEAESTDGEDNTVVYGDDDVTIPIRVIKVVLSDGADESAIQNVEISSGKNTILEVEQAPESVVENGEFYAGSQNLLTNAYNINSNGGSFVMTLDEDHKDNGAYGIRVDYDYEGKGYAGGTKLVEDIQLSNYTGFSLYLEPDGSGNDYKIQIETDLSTFSYTDFLNGTEPCYVKMDFTDFNEESWAGTGHSLADATVIKSVSVYTDFKGDRESGTFYFDSLILE